MAKNKDGENMLNRIKDFDYDMQRIIKMEKDNYNNYSYHNFSYKILFQAIHCYTYYVNNMYADLQIYDKSQSS